ncbi:sequence-specific DNA binding transcription factors [Euphorbia peplus]|nr:sequence-specific DNA binding transcription factors [Euphorbia peplus]
MICHHKLKIAYCVRTQTNWRTKSEQQIYSVKLLEALWRSHPSVKRTEIRQIADKFLIVAAKGRTRWSRAILAGKLIRLRVRKVKKVKVSGGRRELERCRILREQ